MISIKLFLNIVSLGILRKYFFHKYVLLCLLHFYTQNVMADIISVILVRY